MLAGDAAFRPLMVDSAAALAQAVPHTTLTMTVAGMLYGGIVEELLMRWGVMTLLAWIGWRLTSRAGKREPGAPSKVVMWTAITLAALLFGAGHLPTTAMIVSLTPVVIVRALVLNGIGGMLFGWLYWQRSLEAAMIAHATFHVVATIVALLGSMLS
jgi:membrane protease YdiL (CAAX protease family)